MKRKSAVILICSILVGVLSINLVIRQAFEEHINNKVFAQTLNVDGVTLVPVREVLEKRGAYMTWDPNTKQMIVSHKTKVAKFTLGSNKVKINEVTYQMPVNAQVVNGRIMCPLSFISKHFDVPNYLIDVPQTDRDKATIVTDPCKLDGEYDVVVIGGDPEGVAAAVAAARNGANTLLVEEKDGLGGLLTYGMLNQLDLAYDKNGKLANQGIFREWHKMVGGKGVFDIQAGKEAFLALVRQEENITLCLNTEILKGIKDKDRVSGIVLHCPNGLKKISVKAAIDASSDADFAAAMGVPWFFGQEDTGMRDVMAATLVMVLDNVDWNAVKKAAKSGVFGGGVVDNYMGYGFAEIKDVYQPLMENTQLRGLNLGRRKDGTFTINALQIFGVDGTDPQSIEAAMKKGKKETENILKFMRESFPGFENARIAAYPSELYIRESRHIKAEYQLSIVDVWENRDQWDSIGLGAYPVDIQASGAGGYGSYVTNPIQYAIPFRSLVPLEIAGLLVASKASGYSSLAAGSARTVPVGMTVGQAAGTAAAISIQRGMSFRDMIGDKMVVEEMQTRLREQGALLYPFKLDYPYKGEWFYPAIRTLLPYGLIQAGYDNDLHVEAVMSQKYFLKLVGGAVVRSNPEKNETLKKSFDPWERALYTPDSLELTRDKAADILIKYFNVDLGEELLADPWTGAYKAGLIDDFIYKRIDYDRPLTNAEGYYIAAGII